MAKKVTQYVHVTDHETGESVVLEPGDTAPAWAEKLITNKAAFEEVDGPETGTEDVPVAGPGQSGATSRAEASRRSREAKKAKEAAEREAAAEAEAEEIRQKAIADEEAARAKAAEGGQS